MKKQSNIKVLFGCLVAVIALTSITYICKKLNDKKLLENKELASKYSETNTEKGINDDVYELKEIGKIDNRIVYKGNHTIKLGEIMPTQESDVSVTSVKETNKICFDNSCEMAKESDKYIVVEAVINNKSDKPFKLMDYGSLLYYGNRYFKLNYDLSKEYNKEENRKQGEIVLIPGGCSNYKLYPGKEYKYYTVYNIPKNIKLEELEVGNREGGSYINRWSSKK